MNPERRNVTLEILSAAPVQGRDGPQWQLEVQYSWSQYPAKAWIDRDDGAPIAPGMYQCIVERGPALNPEKTDKDYHYRWNIIGFTPTDVPETPKTKAEISDAQVASRPGPPIENYIDPTRVSIERQTALKAAVEFEIAMMAKDGVDTVQDVIATAQHFYDWLHAVSPQATSAPENDPWEGYAKDEPHPADAP